MTDPGAGVSASAGVARQMAFVPDRNALRTAQPSCSWAAHTTVACPLAFTAELGLKNPSLPRAVAPDGTHKRPPGAGAGGPNRRVHRVCRGAPEHHRGPGVADRTDRRGSAVQATGELSHAPPAGNSVPCRDFNARGRPARLMVPEVSASPFAASAPARRSALRATMTPPCQVRSGAAACAVVPTSASAAATPTSPRLRRIRRG